LVQDFGVLPLEEPDSLFQSNDFLVGHARDRLDGVVVEHDPAVSL
jgi:hypothetical protein